MRRPKITILRKIIVSPSTGHYRFFSPNFSYEAWKKAKSSRKYPPGVTVDLSDDPSDYPHVPNIWNERDLCRWVFDRWGSGEYRIIGHMKGRRGAWTFWKGEINEDGFQFEQRSTLQSGSVKALKKELDEEEDPEFQAMIAEEITEASQDITKRRYGFIPYLKPTGRRGMFITWDDAYAVDTTKTQEEVEEDNWGANEQYEKDQKSKETQDDKVW